MSAAARPRRHRLVGRHTAQAAIDAGDDLTLFNRGVPDPGLFPGAEHVRGDRRADGLAALLGRRFDAIVDWSAYFPADVEAPRGSRPTTTC
jgi:2'-hydroxyisoflavone reductase